MVASVAPDAEFAEPRRKSGLAGLRKPWASTNRKTIQYEPPPRIWFAQGWLARARTAIFDRIEDAHTKPLNGERDELRDALTMLDSLRRIAERMDQVSR